MIKGQKPRMRKQDIAVEGYNVPSQPAVGSYLAESPDSVYGIEYHSPIGYIRHSFTSLIMDCDSRALHVI